MITITLANGKQLTNLHMDGNNYVSTQVLDPSVFTNNLHRIHIEETIRIDGETHHRSNQYENMSLDYFAVKDGKTYFVLNPVSPLEMQIAKIRSNIDYLAMMTGNDIMD